MAGTVRGLPKVAKLTWQASPILTVLLVPALIYGVGATDPVTFIAVPVVLGIIDHQ